MSCCAQQRFHHRMPSQGCCMNPAQALPAIPAAGFNPSTVPAAPRMQPSRLPGQCPPQHPGWAPPGLLLAVPLLPVSIVCAMGSVHGEKTVPQTSSILPLRTSVAYNIPSPNGLQTGSWHNCCSIWLFLFNPLTLRVTVQITLRPGEEWELQAAPWTSGFCKRGNLAASSIVFLGAPAGNTEL